MKKEIVIANTEKFVQERLAKEGTGHDWWHIYRVRNNARLICQTEKADRFVVEMAVMLHDVGDRKVVNKDEDDFTIAENFLKKQKVPPQISEQIMYIIKHMSFGKSFDNQRYNTSIEFQVVQDADRLDAIGAIGIARAFTFGGNKGRPLYDPTQKARKVRSYADYKKLDTSTLHHFYEKLLLLKDLMHTKTAKKIALQRHTYMKKYLKQFLLEWEGKK